MLDEKKVCMDGKKLSNQLRNIGPRLAQKLIQAGINSPEKLRKLGSLEAFHRIDAVGGFCGKYNALYLYALEGAILDCDWLDIPSKKKRFFKKYTEIRRREYETQRSERN